MDFFDKFSIALEKTFRGDLNAMINSSEMLDRYFQTRTVVERDSRKDKANGFVKWTVVKDPEPVEEPVVEKPEPEPFDFEVIDLEKYTAANNPVQPKSVEPKPAQRANKSPRGSVIPSQKKGKVTPTIQVSGNRKQRRAAKAAFRKSAIAKDLAKGGAQSSDRQEAGAPKTISLKDMKFGFRLE